LFIYEIPADSLTGNSPLPPPPQSASTDANEAPKLLAPSQVEEANAIDLNPAASDAEQQPSRTVPEPCAGSTEPSTGSTEPPIKRTTVPSTGLTEPSAGMSATSGPLGDHMAEAYVDDEEEDVGSKGEILEESGRGKKA